MALDETSVLWKAGFCCKLYWKIIFALVWPLILLPFVIVDNFSKESKCGYVVLIMAGYWVTECLPLGVTALLPLVLFPCLGVLSSDDTCACYANDVIMVFLGGLILAIAIEHSNLHMRIALKVIRIVGCSHKRLLGGLLVVTTFLSMWITNTAATAMMVPIIFAVLGELEREGLGKVFVDTQNPESGSSEVRPTKVTTAYLMGAAYAASFGGTATLVGTGTNLVFKGIFEKTFACGPKIGFGQWMLYGVPLAYTNALMTWVYVLVLYFGMFRPNSRDAQDAAIGTEGEIVANRIIKERYDNLGKMTSHELGVAAMFVSAVFLWLARDPGFMPGWAELVSGVEILDSAPIIFVALLMFFIPKDLNFLNMWSNDESKRPKSSSEGLITWKVIQAKMPWSLMFLLGGGFAMSKAITKSGLALKVGNAMTPLENLPPWLILVFVNVIVGTITEIMSNVGMANIMLPILASMSVSVKINPLFIMVPATMMCSHTFRFPAGTPPNAIITVTGHVPVKRLILGGCGPSIYSLLLVSLSFPFLGAYVFEIHEFPSWAVISDNGTILDCNNQ
ncbi:protein I'm not dead yet-like [Copidosoma floridanum]|uniref:protein I'm not dead yet-like n=1 Tax=Copidosoma floridanum TaxID=29053 RepID=UPI000C6FBD3D|nr:protein I'm not dead yet-like [Copidosoma floridanum]